MTLTLNDAAVCYELFEGDVPVAFIAVLHQPTTNRRKMKRCSRLVVLPDYQGIGLGKKFLAEIARKYHEDGYAFTITTSARNLAGGLLKDWRFVCTRRSIAPRSGKTAKMKSSARRKCVTYSFEYRG